jgi:hypothetical protein
MREILRILRFAWFVIGIVQGIRKGAQQPEPAGKVDRLGGAPALCGRLGHAAELPDGRVGLVAADPDFHPCSLATVAPANIGQLADLSDWRAWAGLTDP